MNPIRMLLSSSHSMGIRRAGRIMLLLLLIAIPAKASNILFLVANLTLLPGDAAAKATMESMGHVVTVKLGSASVTADAAGTNLVVVSSTIASGDVGAKFKTVTQPVIVWENAIFDDMGLTGTLAGTDYGTTAALSQVVIQTTGHQLSAGLTGTPSVTTGTRTQNFGKPGTGAIKIANQVGDATKLALFAYDVGGAMVGLNAPGRRVAIFFADDSPNALTPEGLSLFKASVSWSLGIVPPTITTQPANASVTAPSTATFSVVAAGSAPTYQWRKGGVDIAGATAASYTTPATSTADNGALYSVVVTNSAGTVTSANAALTVNTAPSITTQPANQTVTAGQTATFSVVASGSATLTYQWRKAGVNIAGATAATYTTPATVTGDNGSLYSVVVTNGFGNVTSANATLTVNAGGIAPAITTQPANQSVTVGQTATFSVVATGTATLTYQWRKAGVNIAGATAASYITPATVIGDNNAAFSVVVTNGFGTATSNNAILTVNAAATAPAITGQPAGQTVVLGQTATFTVTATGTAPLTYQWRKGGVNIAGATSASYITPATVGTDDGALFSVVVSNSAGTATSNNATLTVASPPGITSQPANQTVTAPATATFSVTATGTATLTYQWRKGGAIIAGATAASYTTPPTTAADNGTVFSVVIANAAGNLTSGNATLTVNYLPIITAQPQSQTVSSGQPATFTVAANANPTATYQWKRNGANISGATTANYTLAAAASADNGVSFSVTVTNSVGPTNSSGAVLTVGAKPTSQTVNLSGELFDNANNPIGAGTAVNRDVTVNLYAAVTGGSALYTETFLAANGQAVSVQDGLFTVRLGMGAASQDLQSVVSANADLYADFLIGTPGAQELIQPRLPVSAPLLSGIPRVLSGTVVPTAAAPLGAYYRNTTDNSLWVRMSDAWIKISP
ncbi:MAG: hypothetical protein JWP91_3929 [Fibrobacteres bacterium]|nr:hypothetical protein [Fibrobacterota bacterium]